jgi:hypothetical protein
VAVRSEVTVGGYRRHRRIDFQSDGHRPTAIFLVDTPVRARVALPPAGQI